MLNPKVPRLESKVALTVFLAFLLVNTACFLSYRNVLDANATSQAVAQAYRVLTHLNIALTDLTDAEAGTRGYLLTGESVYLERQSKDFADADASLKEVAALTIANVEQQKRVASLRHKFGEKAVFLKEVAQLRRSGDEERARDLFETGQGRKMMQEVREVADSIEQNEQAPLDRRQRSAAASARDSVKLIILGGVLNALVLAFAFLTVAREMRARQKLERELRHDAERLASVVNTQNQIVETEFDLTRVMQMATESARMLARATAATIVMNEGNRLVRLAASEPYLSMSELRQETVTRLTADCFERNETILCNDLGPAAIVIPPPGGAAMPEVEADPRSALLVPLRKEGEPCGVLKVFSTMRNAFRSSDAKAIELIAGFVVAAMNNARAFEGRAQLIKELGEANEELEAFSYSVSHDLRAPLRHIGGFADLRRQQLGQQADEKTRRYLSVIGESIRHMGLLIDELLAFARVGRAELQLSTFDLTATLNGVIENLRSSMEGRTVEWKVAPLPPVNADAGMLRQV